MDFKKIKPNDVLGFLDDLVAKIPESISSLLTKVMIGILIVSILYAMYYGYQKGYGSAEQEGQQLAKDTKSLFLEDIEREYNRKRKNVRMPSADTFISEDMYKTQKQYESYGRNTEKESLIPPSDSLLERNSVIRENKGSGDTSPLAELNDTPGSAPTPNIPLENQDTVVKPKRKLQLKDNFDSPLSNSDNQDFNSALDKVTNDSEYENKILKKQETSKPGESLPPMPGKRKLSKDEKKGKLFPLDGNE